MDKILKEFGKEKIEEVVKISNSFVEATQKLGLDPKKGSIKRNVERSIKRLGLSTEHFKSVQRVREFRKRYNKETLSKLVEMCHNYKDILLELDILPTTNNYITLKKYIKLYGLNFNPHQNFRWSYDNLKKAVENAQSLFEVFDKLEIGNHGGNFKTFKKYINMYNIDISHFNGYKNNIYNNKINISEILLENSLYGGNLKQRLYDDGLKERRCEMCGQDENWRGKHMSMILDHINGINNDNRIENLRIVCPNCNATLETHCRGFSKINNRNKKEIKDRKKIKVYGFLSRRTVERPPLGELKKEIEKLGLEGTGRKYSVTGNAIKKWVKTYQKYNI